MEGPIILGVTNQGCDANLLLFNYAFIVDFKMSQSSRIIDKERGGGGEGLRTFNLKVNV